MHFSLIIHKTRGRQPRRTGGEEMGKGNETVEAASTKQGG